MRVDRQVAEAKAGGESGREREAAGEGEEAVEGERVTEVEGQELLQDEG